MEQIIKVDINDNQIGVIEKLQAHRSPILHRAFSVFLYDDDKKILLQKRADNKYHSGGLWANSCCSHPRANVDFLTSVYDKTEILTLKNYIKDKYFNQNIVDNLKQQRFEPIDYIKSIKADNSINQSKMEFTFGQAQKVVNMFFKYLYTFKDEQCVKLSEQDFDNCDCPIDSIILDKLYKTEKYKGTVWSKIDGGQYNEIQKDIQNIVNNSTKYKNKLDFEFDWE